MAVKRSYDSTRRQRQAAQTKRDVLDAALSLFTERGYPATTMDAIAGHAQVSEATAYAAFGSKRGILAALRDLIHEQIDYEHRVRAFDEASTPEDQIAAAVRIASSFPHRHLDILSAMLSARGVDPDVDEFLEQGLVKGHRGGAGRLASRLAAENALRPELTEKEAGDLVAAISRIEVYKILSKEFGWSHKRIQEILTDVLKRSLLR